MGVGSRRGREGKSLHISGKASNRYQAVQRKFGTERFIQIRKCKPFQEYRISSYAQQKYNTEFYLGGKYLNMHTTITLMETQENAVCCKTSHDTKLNSQNKQQIISHTLWVRVCMRINRKNVATYSYRKRIKITPDTKLYLKNYPSTKE
jgi:hypothetical protein